jgi:nicotinate dehydrogenase subunit B
MSDDQDRQSEVSRRTWLDAPEAVLVMSDSKSGSSKSELFLAVEGDGKIVAFSGHVDLGTGIRTALAQIVAEELDVPLNHVVMVLGDTGVTPNQGPTIASETIQITAVPLRFAAACARRYFVAEAARQFGLDPQDLIVEAGIVRSRNDDNLRVAYGALVQGRRVILPLDTDVPVKPVASYSLVGSSVGRVDIAAKATGEWIYVHDVRVPGMLHGRVVRPPYAGIDVGPQVGRSLVEVDKGSIADVPGVRAVVVDGDFVGIVAEREEDAARAARQLHITWKPWSGLPDLNAPEAAVRANPSSPRRLLDHGDVERGLAGLAEPMDRTYVWPYQMHGSIGPSCSVADYSDDRVTIWSGTQNPHSLRDDLALLLGLPEDRVVIHRHEAAGCYGRNCADDVSADAALLSRAVRSPVRVQLTREQEHAWEPKGAAQVMDVRGGLDEEGGPAVYDFETRYPSNAAPTLALLLTGRISSTPVVTDMGDRTAIPPYAYGNARVTVHDMPPIARASWFRGVSALPNTFAHESFVDELAIAAGVDPIEYRLRYLSDARAVDLVRAVAERAQWAPHSVPGTLGGAGDILYGRGFAYAVYVHGKFPGTAAAWSAWVADVAVNKMTGEVAVTRVVVGQDTGLMINPAGVQHQIHGNVIQSTSRVLKEQVGFDLTGVTSREWGAYPILTFAEVPAIDVLLLPRQDEPPLGAGESASVPSAAAITNAIFDATGVRFRELPLTAERVRAALNPLPPPVQATEQPKRWGRRLFGALNGLLGVSLGLTFTALQWRSEISPIPRPDPGVFSRATIEQGRLVAAAGACMVCHDAGNGTAYAGGRPIQTPFGIVYATNITPDTTHGIGAWSYPAFERAMRDGVHRDGHHLYPAHPYTSFTKADDADLQALYAYLMNQRAVARPAPQTALRFPFNFRPLMAVWNFLFLRPGVYTPDPNRSDEWNRGAYLVEGLGHCGACHTSRNVFGAERAGRSYLDGGFADGWEAPALNSLSQSPTRWDKASLYTYLRTGHSVHHGGAAGPMANVVAALAPLPDDDIRAMATYLASHVADTSSATSVEPASVTASADIVVYSIEHLPGAQIFKGACASCHESSDLVSLEKYTSLHSDHAHNVLQAILNGIAAPAGRIAGRLQVNPEIAEMPSFRESLNDAQVAELGEYLRARFAPDKATWSDLAKTSRNIRALH